MIQLADLAQVLDRFFGVERYGDDQNGVYRPSARPIRRLGIALEPWSELSAWAHAEQLDALFLHRPWRLQPGQLSADVGIVAYHLAFDERLTLGLNSDLAEALHMREVESFGEKQGRPIGMIGDVPAQDFAAHCQELAAIFGGYDAALNPTASQITRVAVVGAMTDVLVRGAAAHAVNIYITGQLRQPAQNAVEETGIGVLAIGHRRSEQWGLRALARVLRERWAELEVLIAPVA